MGKPIVRCVLWTVGAAILWYFWLPRALAEDGEIEPWIWLGGGLVLLWGGLTSGLEAWHVRRSAESGIAEIRSNSE